MLRGVALPRRSCDEPRRGRAGAGSSFSSAVVSATGQVTIGRYVAPSFSAAASNTYADHRACGSKTYNFPSFRAPLRRKESERPIEKESDAGAFAARFSNVMSASHRSDGRSALLMACAAVLPANFVVRSKANPESEERDFDAWASAWSQTTYRKGPA